MNVKHSVAIGIEIIKSRGQLAPIIEVYRKGQLDVVVHIVPSERRELQDVIRDALLTIGTTMYPDGIILVNEAWTRVFSKDEQCPQNLARGALNEMHEAGDANVHSTVIGYGMTRDQGFPTVFHQNFDIIDGVYTPLGDLESVSTNSQGFMPDAVCEALERNRMLPDLPQAIQDAAGLQILALQGHHVMTTDALAKAVAPYLTSNIQYHNISDIIAQSN